MFSYLHCGFDLAEASKNKFCWMFEQKVLATRSMEICTETPTLGSGRKNSVFFYNWYPVAKNDVVFNKFY